jgi:hypothetical protein
MNESDLFDTDDNASYYEDNNAAGVPCDSLPPDSQPEGLPALALESFAHETSPVTSVMEPRFSGFGEVTAINDNQGYLPTCFPESVENVLQLYHGDTGGIYNALAQNILEYAKGHGLAFMVNDHQWVIPNNCQQAILYQYGIPTELHDFDHQSFKHYLDQQCPILLGVDSAYLGNPISGAHCITLVDMQTGTDGYWYYRILDSAHPEQEWYPAATIEAAAMSALRKWPDGHNGCALICQLPAKAWPFRT